MRDGGLDQYVRWAVSWTNKDGVMNQERTASLTDTSRNSTAVCNQLNFITPDRLSSGDTLHYFLFVLIFC